MKVATNKAMQITLAILKPDILIHTARTKVILNLLRTNGFSFLESRKLWLNRDKVENFYAIHKGKFFYERLITFMSSGYIMAMILERENAILHWREMLGPTSPYRARHIAPESLRALYGISDTRNVGHGSDCDSTAEKEIGIFFPQFDFEKWRSKTSLDMESQ